jgi:phenylacetate-CoA ligase
MPKQEVDRIISSQRATPRLESISVAKKLYNHIPWYLQDLMISAYGFILQRRVSSPAVQQCLTEYLESQWFSTEDLATLQTIKLQKLLEHSYRNVPYYQRVFDGLHLKPEDIHEVADLQKLPLLTKKDVRENADDLLARNIGRSRLNYDPTSGTTGTPMPIYVTRRNQVTERALKLRQRVWAGWQPGQRRVTFSGFMVVPPGPQPPPYWRYDWPERRLFMSSYHMTQENIPLYVNAIRSFHPQFIESYPSYLTFVSQYLEKVGETIHIPMIFTSSETLYPHQRQLIEERLCGKIFDFYGLTEKAASAVQCEQEDGYHVNLEKTIIEIVKPDGENALPGEYGQVVGTNLEEYGMPLIRYTSGDWSALRPEPCPCGRNHPLIEQIQTRVDDIIISPDGRLINPAPLAGLFRHTGIEKARIIQETTDNFTVMLEVNDRYDETIAEPIAAGIKRVIGSQVQVSFEIVEDIPSSKNGKYPFIVSRVGSSKYLH